MHRNTFVTGGCTARDHVLGGGNGETVTGTRRLELRAAVRDRAVAGLTDIARRHRGATVVVVSHDAVNRQVLAALRPDLGEPDTLPQDNGCFNTLEERDGTWAVLAVNKIPQAAKGTGADRICPDTSGTAPASAGRLAARTPGHPGSPG